MILSRRIFLGTVAASVAAAPGGARPAPLPSPAPGRRARIGSGSSAGDFVFSAADQSRAVASDPLGGVFVAPDHDRSGASGAWVRQTIDPIRPEWFGAEGDGQTNDTRALAALADYVSYSGGGTVAFRRTTYVVGLQVEGHAARTGYAFEPHALLEFRGCSKPLIIRGNGAKLKCVAGLRFGTFSAGSGRATRNAMPYIRPGELATPYRTMIQVEGSRAHVEITDLELDGSSAELMVGGPYGDAGIQIPAHGLSLLDNRGSELVRDVFSHHHACDGIIINGLSMRRTRSSFERVRSTHNGRQGCSIVGGVGYAFTDCKFNHTGRAGIVSSPGAGVDIEAEGGKTNKDLSFVRCEFSDNSGPGMVADSGPSEGATFDRCVFIGTTSWAVWPKKPGFRFADCSFVGPIVHAFGDATDPARAAQFHRCTFRDDPALTPTGTVYGGDGDGRPIGNLPSNPNLLFRQCAFRLTHQATLPWTTNVVIFEDCVLEQRSPVQAYPRGTFIGRNSITGNVGLYSARNMGTLIVNGVAQARFRG